MSRRMIALACFCWVSAGAVSASDFQPAMPRERPGRTPVLVAEPAHAAQLAPSSEQPATDETDEEMARLREKVRDLQTRLEAKESPTPVFWLALGFLGQSIFGLRFVVQWIATERRKKSVVPLAFWYLSIVGTIILLTYSIYLLDPVFIAGFSLNMIIYLRNLYFIHRRPAPAEAKDAGGGE